MMTYKTTLKNIKNNLYNIFPLFIPFYLTFMGFFWIIIFCYLRFITPRTSYTLEALKTQITLRYYITFSIFIIIHCTLIILILYNKYKKKEENETIIKKIIEIFQSILNNVFWKPLEYIHNLIAPNLPLSARIFLYIESIWTKKNVDHTYFYSLITIFNILPKIITVIIFFIDIVILGSFKYFIYVLPVMLIPLFFNIFLKLFKSFAERNAPILKEYFSEIKYVGDVFDEKGILISSDPTAYEFHIKPEYNHADDIEESINLLFRLDFIVEYVNTIKEKLQEITPTVTIITSSIYLIGGLYRLIYFLI